MKPPVQSAVIFALLAIWMGLGVFREPQAKPEGLTAFQSSTVTSVRVSTLDAQDFRRPVRVRASTQAERHVPVTSRITAVVTDVPVREGFAVQEGELLCQLEEEANRAALVQAEVQLKTAEVDWQATRSLVEQGLGSELDVARKEASLKNADALLKRARLNLEHTQIRAPFSGILDEISAEVGEVLTQGRPCALLLDLDPIRVDGQVAEAEVEYIVPGNPIEVEFGSGLRVPGELAFVSRSAERGSRTFRVEARIPNPDRSIRHGLSADLLIFSRAQKAHHIPASALMLDAEEGVVVKVLSDADEVEQFAVEILYDDADGVWVAGLPDRVRLITVGHYYVGPGQTVIGVEDRVSADGLGDHLSAAEH